MTGLKPATPRRPRRPALWLGAAMVFYMLPALGATSDYRGELIPFPQATLHFRNKDAGTAQQHGSEALVDFFYSAKYRDTWRLLSEVSISDDEREVERLVVGKVTPDGNQLWLGRYHTGLGQWNHKFHHGAYLQTTIHRPGIIEWEDYGGVIPTHATGVSANGIREVNGRVLTYALELGLGPGLGDKGDLVALNLLDFSDGEHDLAVTGRIGSHLPDAPFDESGVFAGHITIPSQATNIRKVQQTVLGAYTHYTAVPMTWLASLFYVSNDLDLTGGNSRTESFTYFYVQPEYARDALWTYYGRVEKSFGAKHDLYLRQIPAFITERALVGARYQLNNNQAVKLELAALDQYDQRFISAEIQWSAALP